MCPGKLAWILYCDVICLDLDGNLFDACLLAVMAALSAVTLPLVSMDGTTKVVTVTTAADDGVNGKGDGVKRRPLGISDVPGKDGFCSASECFSKFLSSCLYL